MVPANSVSETFVGTPQVQTVKVGIEAGRVPPGSLEPLRTILAPSVVVSVHRAELGPPCRKAFSDARLEILVENAISVLFVRYFELVDDNGSPLAIPIFQVYPELDGFFGSQQKHRFQAYPKLSIRPSESVSIIRPCPEKVIRIIAEISSPLKNGPTASRAIHVAENCLVVSSDGRIIDAGSSLVFHANIPT